mmetsp:Transcript_47779/g.137006  ORF Transcript_47779/g.137006 Transcript_47779/m.137006 type:complete len:334 (-) Transcript_47779:1421-2422(-)
MQGHPPPCCSARFQGISKEVSFSARARAFDWKLARSPEMDTSGLWSVRAPRPRIWAARTCPPTPPEAFGIAAGSRHGMPQAARSSSIPCGWTNVPLLPSAPPPEERTPVRRSSSGLGRTWCCGTPCSISSRCLASKRWCAWRTPRASSSLATAPGLGCQVGAAPFRARPARYPLSAAGRPCGWTSLGRPCRSPWCRAAWKSSFRHGRRCSGRSPFCQIGRNLRSSRRSSSSRSCRSCRSRGRWRPRRARRTRRRRRRRRPRGRRPCRPAQRGRRRCRSSCGGSRAPSGAPTTSRRTEVSSPKVSRETAPPMGWARARRRKRTMESIWSGSARR